MIYVGKSLIHSNYSGTYIWSILYSLPLINSYKVYKHNLLAYKSVKTFIFNQQTNQSTFFYCLFALVLIGLFSFQLSNFLKGQSIYQFMTS